MTEDRKFRKLMLHIPRSIEKFKNHYYYCEVLCVEIEEIEP